MIYIFFSTMLTIGLILITFLIYLIKKLKSKHRIEIQLLQSIINQLTIVNNDLKDKITIIKKSENNLQTSRLVIDKKLINLQDELINKLADNKLIE